VYTVLCAMFQSPWFIYRTEMADELDAGRIPLDGWDLASKLSFALHHTIPDEALLAAARDGSLLTGDGYAAQLDRLLQSPAADAVIDHFHEQLLLLDTYENIYKDPDALPAWSPSLNGLMREEALLFGRSVVRDGEGVRDFYTTPRTFVNRDLAPLYGLSVDSETMVPVDLDAAQRAGVLTLSGFLTAQSYANEIDSIHRGVFVSMRLLCSSLPPPPDDIPPLPLIEDGQTNRERVDAHTGDGTCGAGCHSVFINPVGFAFENFDPIGRWRDTDNGRSVDASGTYNFVDGAAAWDTPVEFASVLSASTDAHSCMTRNWMRYLHGREAAEQDEALIEDIAQRSLAQDLAIQDVIRELLMADAFRTRSPEVTP
ncbi:MAG: DUF1592 domain-containing protein, partial [Myxococcota bacterium]